MKERQEICGYILAGGKNRRMNGYKKIFLEYEGATFCERILQAFEEFAVTYISVEAESPYQELHLPVIVDEYAAIGPMGGIYSGMKSCDADALFVVACDMPMVTGEAVQRVTKMYSKQHKITVVRTNGRLHPLFGIYPRTVLPKIEKAIEKKDYRMMNFLKENEYQVVDLGETAVAENINTVEDYQKLKDAEKKPFIFAISGYKNSGKTTLITKLIPVLTQKGYKVAVIKHDGHDFESDVPGTDSYRHQKAGAYGTAVFSSKRMMITKETEEANERDLMRAFPEADIILLEGLKHSPYPKYFCNYPEQEPMPAEELAEEIIKQMKSFC